MQDFIHAGWPHESSIFCYFWKHNVWKFSNKASFCTYFSPISILILSLKILYSRHLGLVPGNSRAGIPGNFPKIFSPAWSREFFRFPGKFREIFMYCDWQIFRFHSILEIFLWAQNQTLLSKMIVTKLKIILLPQKMHFLSKMGYFRLAIK